MSRNCTDHPGREAIDNNGTRYCRECNLKTSLIWAANNRSRQRNNKLLKLYGISLIEYNELLEKQNGVCAICDNLCSVRKNLCVDHDKKTGKVRGLLCFACNTAIGKLDHDIELLESAIQYLRSSK